MGDPVLVVMRQTRIQLPSGHIITLTPGLKSQAVSETLRSRVPTEHVKLLKAKGRLVEAAPPW